MEDSFDEPLQSQKTSIFVIPANAGIQFWHVLPGFRVMISKKPAIMPGMTALENDLFLPLQREMLLMGDSTLNRGPPVAFL